jgi:hypothetical protein
MKDMLQDEEDEDKPRQRIIDHSLLDLRSDEYESEPSGYTPRQPRQRDPDDDLDEDEPAPRGRSAVDQAMAAATAKRTQHKKREARRIRRRAHTRQPKALRSFPGSCLPS